MFDDANRFYSSAISVNSQSVIMAVLWISLLIVVFHLIRKRIKLVQNFGIVTLIIMLLLMLVRVFFPLDFKFTKNIPSILYGNLEYFFEKVTLFSIPGIDFAVTPLAILLTVWAVGSVVSFLLFVHRSRKALRCLKDSMHAPLPKDQEILDMAENRMGKSHRVVLYRALVMTPLTYGYFRPKILIPAGKKYSDQELYCALLHELFHFYHRDAWIKLLVQLLCSLLWWNPLMYLFQRDVTQTLELHCDAATYARMTSMEQCDYMTTLANAVKASKEMKILAMQSTGSSSELAAEMGRDRMNQRISLLIGAHKMPKHSKRYYFLVTLVMVAALFCTYLFILTPFHTQYYGLENYTNGTPVTQENSYLLEYPEDCYFLVTLNSSDSEQPIQTFVPLDDSETVRQALEERQLEIKTVDKEGFLQVLADTGSQDPEADYLFWAYLYFPEYLTEEEKASFPLSEEEILKL